MGALEQVYHTDRAAERRSEPSRPTATSTPLEEGSHCCYFIISLVLGSTRTPCQKSTFHTVADHKDALLVIAVMIANQHITGCQPMPFSKLLQHYSAHDLPHSAVHSAQRGGAETNE